MAKKGKGLMFWLPIIAVTGGLAYLAWTLLKKTGMKELPAVRGSESATPPAVASEKRIAISMITPRPGEDVSSLGGAYIEYQIYNNEPSAQTVYVSAKVWDSDGREIASYPLAQVTAPVGTSRFKTSSLGRVATAWGVAGERIIGLSMYEDAAGQRLINAARSTIRITTIG